MDDFEKELKEDFLEEAVTLLENAEQSFLRLETERGDQGILDEIFRLAHNLKGTSRAVGFGEVAEFTHVVENLILKLKEGEIEANDDVVSLLLSCNDHIVHMVNTLKDDLDSTFDSVDLISQLEAVTNGAGANTSSEETQEAPTENQKEEPKDIEELRAEIAAEEALKAEQEKSENDAVANANTEPKNDENWEEDKAKSGPMSFHGNVEQEKKAAPRTKSKSKSEDESIRVNLSKVEKLNNIVGELVILQTVLDQRRYSAIQDELSIKSISHLGKLSKEIQEISMGLRMIPIKATFNKMVRIVRDTSKALDKKINLDIQGDDTEVDKTVLEHLGDPLVHIVRNAIDHGVEDKEKRALAGKSETGEIIIRAYHEGSKLVIEVKDDGAGIKPEVIRQKAIEKKLIRPDQSFTDEQMIQYIFHPGFSTKEQVTEVSGRGVGMDVVKTNIEDLGGEAKVQSVVGEGSTFKIILPLTLAIIDGMVVTCGMQKYIIPLSQIQESLRPTEEMLNKVTGFGECLNLRGDVIPLFDVRNTLKVPANPDIEGNEIAIIVKTEDKYFAVKVDDIINQQQVVVKTIGEEIKNKRGFMGSTILGDGKPSFIIDLVDLFEKQVKEKDRRSVENFFKESMIA